MTTDHAADGPGGTTVGQIPTQVLDLMLDVLLDVMQAERGSVMLLDPDSQELTIQSARGLRNEIVRKARVRLGAGVSGKVAASGQPIFIHGVSADRREPLQPDDLVEPALDTSFIVPITFRDGVVGTVNISSGQPGHAISERREQVVKGIIHRFLEYLAQADLPDTHFENPTQLDMMNVFREHATLRELRTVFDLIFRLLSDMMSLPRKGLLLLRNQQSGDFDLVLGYGFDPNNYRRIYEGLLPVLRQPGMAVAREIHIFHRRDLGASLASLVQEEVIVGLPLGRDGHVLGQAVLLADREPELDPARRQLLHLLCTGAGELIEENTLGRRFHELTGTDSLTGTYSYGLWWKRLHEEFNRAARLKRPEIGLIMLDIDHFSRFNQAHGYLVGDELLRLVADRVRAGVREIDIVGRVGGEEFAVALPGAGKENTRQVARRILESVRRVDSELNLRLAQPISVSFGLAACPDDADNPEQLVERVREALVSAKIMGGNCINVYGSMLRR